MQTSSLSSHKNLPAFPPFDLQRLMRTVFNPKRGEKLCILIDLADPQEVKNYAFAHNPSHPVQIKAYEVIYQGMQRGVMQQFGLAACDLFAYERTGGSNLELPEMAWSPDGKAHSFHKDIYPVYDLIFCIGDFSATAPLTATAKKYGFRGSTMHGLNDTILQTGLAVDYNQVSQQTEKLRLGMTHADHVDIDFEIDQHKHHLHIELARQEAQKSHGICRESPDIVNLPAGEVYFVPVDASGSFPIKFDDGTLALMQVDQNRVQKVTLIRGNPETVKEQQQKFDMDPSAAILGELGFGTQLLPHSGRDIQDEKIFGTFHLATGRNDHLKGTVTLDRFANRRNATHDDILFSPFKTPEIHVQQVRMLRNGKTEILIEHYEPANYLWNLIKAP